MDKIQKEEKKILNIFETSNAKLTTYLQDDEIRNILLSGRFGIGKTTFIEEYFKKEETDYELIKISPVNYSVLSNQDIFKYIKYDILFILLKKVNFNLKSDKGDLISWIEGLPIYLQANIVTLLGSLIFLIPKIGKPAQQIFDFALNHKKEFDKILALANEDENTKFIQSFYNKIEEEEGGIYENNEITKIINQILSFYSDKKKVLVIDDLDRVDPQHIFRILNVLSVQSSYNKFMFEKIILICDIGNIRGIFKTNYGQTADFSGYIDKFYDKEIFYFDNRLRISSYVEEILNSIKLKDNDSGFTKFLQDRKHAFVKVLVVILSDSVLFNQINLRTLLKYHNTTLILKHRTVLHKRGEDQHAEKTGNHQIMMMMIFDFLYKVLDLNLDRVLDFLSTKKSNFSDKKRIISMVLPILNLNESPVNLNEFNYIDSDTNTKIKYKAEEKGINDLFRAFDIEFYDSRDTLSTSQKRTNLPYIYNLINQAFLKLRGNGYF